MLTIYILWILQKWEKVKSRYQQKYSSFNTHIHTRFSIVFSTGHLTTQTSPTNVYFEEFALFIRIKQHFIYYSIC